QRDTQFLMSTGLSLMNRFAALRIANIDTSDAALSTSMPKLKKSLFKAFTLLPKEFKSRVRIYAPGSVLAGLNDYYAGLVQPVTYENAIPTNAIGDVRFDRFIIRQCDSMLDAGEAVVDGGAA
ncbi:MAG: phage major capsid protein, partial [Sphaerochaeta sp.]